MNDTTNPARRLRHGDRPTAPLRWNDRWTLLLTGPHHGMIGPLGSTWPNQSAEYERVDVCVLREDFPVAVFRRGGEGAGSWHKLELISHGTPTDPLRDGEQLYRAGTVPKLESIEQYRMQMAAIGTASFGYWKEGDTIHPDYDTVPLRDVARLFAKYDQLYKFREQVRVMVAMLKNREWAEDLAATGDAAELQSVITELVGKLAAASNWISTGPHGDNCFVSDHHEGDPGNRCNCGKDALQEFLESDKTSHDAVDALTTEEQAFVELVRQRPGHKLNSGEAQGADGTALWERPQALGLIQSVGSYKWIVPGAQAQQPVADAVEAAMADAIVHGTGAFRVHGDGSTEHVDLHAQNRAAAEIVAFSPPPMVRDALYHDYAVPKPAADEGSKGE